MKSSNTIKILFEKIIGENFFSPEKKLKD